MRQYVELIDSRMVMHVPQPQLKWQLHMKENVLQQIQEVLKTRVSKSLIDVIPVRECREKTRGRVQKCTVKLLQRPIV